MNDLILHQVLRSAHGEMIRLILGFKGLTWREVGIPVVLPRPLLTPLTGGYRRHPVLQVGADVYCDTRCIVRFLERHQPKPSLHADHMRFFDALILQWAEPRVFLTGAAIARYQSPEFLDQYFGKDLPREVLMKDRQALLEGSGYDAQRIAELAPYALDQIRTFLEILESRLEESGPFVAGSRPTLADFSAYVPIYLIDMTPRVPVLDRFPGVCAWMERMAAIGYGDVTEMDAAEAMEIAKASRPATTPSPDPEDPVGRKVGDIVSIVPDDYGMTPVVGELVRSDAYEIAVRRQDEVVGDIVIHFPRVGFRVSASDAE